jgi:ATP-binding cassette subfamily B protein
VSEIRRAGALEVVRRGMRATPELRRGALATVGLALLGGAGRVAIPVLVQQVLDDAVLGGGEIDLGRVYRLCAIAAGVVLLTGITTFLTQRRLAVASEGSLFSLRAQAFTHIHRLSIGHQSAERRGALTARVTSDVETLSRFYQWGAVAWIVNGTMMLAAISAMAIYDWRLTLVVVGIALPLVPVLRVVQRHLIRAYDAIRDRVSELLTVLSEVLQGAALVRGYGQEDRSTDRVVAAIEAHRTATVRGGLIGAFLFPINELFAGVIVAAVVAVGVVIGVDGGLTGGELIAFLFLVQLFLQPVGEFTEVLDQTQTAVAGWRKVLDVLDMPIDVPAPRAGVSLPMSAPSVVVEHVHYSYPDDPRPVLRDVSFTIEPGSHVAMVGATGSGKTTVAKLLTRLADPVSGRIMIDGVDLRDVDATSLRRRIVMVPQDGFLFSTSVGENVRFGAPEVTDDEIRDAFTSLGLASWLESLPFGVDTPVGQRGEHLSVGERQLVALVRASVANPTCLVLDEATSAVDPLTETRLSRALEALARGRTSLTIAHRLSTASRADVVLVMEAGELVEQGSHDDLVRAGGVYAGLYDSWLRVTAPT